MPSMAEGTLELSGMTAILLIFQADDQHEQITDVYVGLVVRHDKSHLYAPEKILDFVSNIEVHLKAAHNSLKAGCDPGKRHAFCLFVNNYGGIMSSPHGVFMPSATEGTLDLNGTTAILLIFQADDQHDLITDVYIGLVVHHVKSCLYTPERILDFVSNIEVDLKVAHNTLKAECDPGKRCAFCLFVNNYGGIMSVPTDPPYCLIYPMSYMKDVEPDHFNTCNNPTGTCLHCCICHATLQYIIEHTVGAA